MNDTVGVHAGAHVADDFQRDLCRMRAEVHDVLNAAGAGDRTSRCFGRDPYEHVPGEERLKASPRPDEGQEREKILTTEIELDPSLRASLGVNELPGSIAERRHVGVVHLSDFIHNEGN
ncbi:MAG TPA: hypothetical protein VGO46_08040, partial [Gemmatimonadaceae bacterium]|nr:hypothetical protein [Gemmatimonadaceae bacterium]